MGLRKTQTLIFDKVFNDLIARISKKKVDIDIPSENLAYILLRNKAPHYYKIGADMAFLGYGLMEILNFRGISFEGAKLATKQMISITQTIPNCIAFWRNNPKAQAERDTPGPELFAEIENYGTFLRRVHTNEIFYYGNLKVLDKLGIKYESVDYKCPYGGKCVQSKTLPKIDAQSYVNTLQNKATLDDKFDYLELEKIACSLIKDVKIKIKFNPDAI